jgi:hypothetical protein
LVKSQRGVAGRNLFDRNVGRDSRVADRRAPVTLATRHRAAFEIMLSDAIAGELECAERGAVGTSQRVAGDRPCEGKIHAANGRIGIGGERQVGTVNGQALQGGGIAFAGQRALNRTS